MNKVFWALVAVLVVGTGCMKEKVYPNPALATGQCEYSERGFSDIASASNEMNRVKGILESSTIGEGVVAIIKASTFVTSEKITKKGKVYDQSFGLQIVFSCNQAEIKYFSQRGFNSRLFAENAYLNWKANTPAAKVIDAYTDYYEDCWRDAGVDLDGDGFVDAGSSNLFCDITDYYFAVTYALVNDSNIVQKQILTGLQLLDTVGVKPRTALRVASDYIPLDAATKKELQDWNGILKRIHPNR